MQEDFLWIFINYRAQKRAVIQLIANADWITFIMENKLNTGTVPYDKLLSRLADYRYRSFYSGSFIAYKKWNEQDYAEKKQGFEIKWQTNWF